ncbi:hypothetical protein M433DRAFT_397020 [Acidomyces richmondensis BFW]|nr:MAG: hypothetical protein FE78DRAFT_492605 [Acidomyces sp. 'richmondensis']KYG42675.1 hypothetical protein M433DRAFT_397020 [Acidomyces richmondensis BFW]
MDPEFTREALRLAPYCPLLLYSMLATAAIHKSRFARDPTVEGECAAEAERYHEQCVSLLLPMLQDKDSITDGAFLACSTILRFYEEISAPVHGRDDARHLLGGYASVEATQKQSKSYVGLSNAAFWVHQRQDVYNALINQRVPRTDLSRAGLDRSMSPANECVWAKRATCLNADVVEFCFGVDSGSVSKYHAIMKNLDDWHLNVPDTFRPVYYRENDVASGRYFPDICLLLDCCTFGLSYYCFCMLLMTIYDPTTPKIGSRKRSCIICESFAALQSLTQSHQQESYHA